MGAIHLFKRGFTLVEMMIVVAIVMVLAAVGIPNYFYMQLKAKRAEVQPNVQGLVDALMAYDAATGETFNVLNTQGCGFGCPNPSGPAGKKRRAWNDGAIPAPYAALGWSPDGDVYATYDIYATAPFFAEGQTNLDGDLNPYAYMYGYNDALKIWETPYDGCFSGAVNCY